MGPGGWTVITVGIGLIKALRKHEEPPVEMLDVETLKSRIGDPLPPKKAAPTDNDYMRADGRRSEERSWRRVAGLPR